MADRTPDKSRRGKDLTLSGLGLRFLAALSLVLATYNPSSHSVFAWVRHAVAAGTLGPEHLLVVILLLIGWTVYLVASFRSLGALGLTLGGLFLAALVWLLVDVGLLKADSVAALTWIVLVAIAALLTLGIAWSHLWRRLTGQLEVDDD